MLALLSNVTVAGPFLVNTVKRLCGEPVYLAPGHDTWRQALLGGDFGGQSPRAVFLILDGVALMGERGLESRESVEAILAPCLELAGQFARRHPESPLWVSSLDLPLHPLAPMDARRTELHAMAFWRNGLADAGLPVLELAELAADLGRSRFYCDRTRYFGEAPFSVSGEKAVAGEIHRAWRGFTGQRRKCLVLDLDNTLWGGVIGEDGREGIRLAATGEGAPYRDFQRRLREIKDMGVLLAVCSKNNAEDARAGLEHPGMVLRPEDFVAVKADWSPKAENLRALAGELNLGLDAFVFVDDNPVEREAMRIALPEVATPDFPDPVGLSAFARRLAGEYFPVVRLTAEDRHKSELYRAEQRRLDVRGEYADLEEYLVSLGMRLVVRRVGAADVERVAQMTQKTNQFNLTTRRYTSADIHARLASPEWRLWVGELEDRFGAYGQVCLGMARRTDGEAEFDSLLMSCRVMGRGVERAFLQTMERKLAAEGCLRIEGRWRPTAKNSVVKDFWRNAGYGAIGADAGDGAERFCKTAFGNGPETLAVAVEDGNA